jgi:hypothetical protein
MSPGLRAVWCRPIGANALGRVRAPKETAQREAAHLPAPFERPGWQKVHQPRILMGWNLAPVRTENLNPTIVVMKAAQNGA